MLYIAAWAVVLALAIPTSIFCLEVLHGSRTCESDPITPTSHSAAILVPAHNEAAILGDTLDRLIAVLPDFASVLVVADNCDDETAEVARSFGVTVIERKNPTQRGKGFALAFGRDWLQKSPPDCVIVLDADCQIDKASLEAITATATRRGKPVQASYIFRPDLSVPPKVQISNFAFWIKNVVRQKGARRLGGGAVLTGTGMGFPWAVFEALPLATNSIVEDLELSVELTRRRSAPIFLENALVTSLAATETATLAQRARWEHGFLAIAKAHSFRSVWLGITSANRPLALLGLHLLVPPLALLMAVVCTSAVLLVVASMWTGDLFPAIMVTSLAIIVLCSVLLAWVLEGHRWISAKSMMMVPLYVLWKLPAYLRFVMGRRAEWVRTDRTPS